MGEHPYRHIHKGETMNTETVLAILWLAFVMSPFMLGVDRGTKK